MDSRELGRLMARAREDSGIDLETMARKYGCRKSYLSMVEQGKREASARLINLYAHETNHPEIGLTLIGMSLETVFELFEAGIRHKMALAFLKREA
ncbi:MAG: helix-turn-helix transcriptional regulator [Alicyclobacillus sp.]|nr:helix-turn-helix transcriptional regulator [Alicyclobacillus sp.]